MSKILGFHTCSIVGGRKRISKRAPFISRDNEKQWLTQGYYFWTDSDYYAHIWGRYGYNSEYAIIRCEISTSPGEVLDLVGRVDHQLFFKSLKEDYLAFLKKSGRDEQQATIRGMIQFLRDLAQSNPAFFPFVGIKAFDDHGNDTMLFTGYGKKESMSFMTRQQVCIFESGISQLDKREIIYPKEF